MATSLTLQNDPTLPQGYLKVNGTTAATITENGLSTPTLNTISVDDYTILSDFTGTNQSLTTNGYQRLPGGLIIQWGVAMVAYGTTFTGAFPIAFPNGVLNITGTSTPNVPPQTSALIFVQMAAAGNTSFKIVSYHINLSTGSNAVYWVAIGY
jgi:hypothetical protein